MAPLAELLALAPLPLPPLLSLLLLSLLAVVAVVVLLAEVVFPPPPLPGGVPHVRGWPLLGALLGFVRDPTAFVEAHVRSVPSSSSFEETAFATYLARQPTLVLTNCVDYAHVYKHTEAFSFRELENAITAKAAGMPPAHAAANFQPYVNTLWHTHLQGRNLAVLTLHAARHLAAKARDLPDAAERAGVPVRRSTAGGGQGDEGWHSAPLFDLVFRLLFASGVAMVMGADLDPRPLVPAFRDFERGFPRVAAGLPDIFIRKAFAGRDRIAAAVHGQLQRAGLFARGAKPASDPDHDDEATPPAVSPLQQDRTVYFLQSGDLDAHETARLSALNVWALHANTGPAGFWLLTFILSNPRALAAVRAEIDALYAKHPTFPERYDVDVAPAAAPGDDHDRESHDGASADTAALTSAVLDRALPALTSAMWETLRLTISQFGYRLVTTACEIPLAGAASPASVRPGDRILLIPTHHTDPAIFANPTEFQYDRFMPDPATGAAPVFYKAGVPLRPPVHAFGGGITMCPGRFFAMNEIRLLVVVLLHHWDMHLDGRVPDRSRERAGFGIMQPVHDPTVRFRPRTRASA